MLACLKMTHSPLTDMAQEPEVSVDRFLVSNLM